MMGSRWRIPHGLEAKGVGSFVGVGKEHNEAVRSK